MKKPDEIANLPQIQSDILANVSRYLKKNGVLLYSTCTILEEENEGVVRSFLARHPEFSAEAFSVGTVRSEDGLYTFWPQNDGTDGFFASKLRKHL